MSSISNSCILCIAVSQLLLTAATSLNAAERKETGAPRAEPPTAKAAAGVVDSEDVPDPALHLPGTGPLNWPEAEGALADRLMNGAHKLVERKIAESRDRRSQFWHRDFSSPDAYDRSIAPNRERFKKILGVVDRERVARVALEECGSDGSPAVVAETDTFQVRQVRWPVTASVFSEGLLVAPKQAATSYTIFLSDADQSPEQLAGLTEELPRLSSRIQQAAAEGELVIIPALINRQLYLGPNGDDAGLKNARQSRREWIFRQAFHMGRHIIGYEIQKVMTAVDSIKRHSPSATVRVEGTGEGALLAFYAAACDPRIDSVLLHGYFGSRERVWSEPIYRNVFGLLNEFGDAEIASMIYPRPLVISPAEHPTVTNQKGDIPPFDASQAIAELNRLPLVVREHVQLLDDSLLAKDAPGTLLTDLRPDFDRDERQQRLMSQMETHVQSLVGRSDAAREEFFLYRADPDLRPGKWSTDPRHPTLDPTRFIEAGKEFRRRFEEEALGRFDEALLPLNPRSRKIVETDQWTAYDVVLDVYPELFAWGVLVLPKGIQPGERRPVVVCQHGRGGLPRDTIDAHTTAYNDFAARLAERGFITFAPHNLYRGEDTYRWLDRKANTIGCTLFSFITASHRQMLSWLKAQAFVDPARIAFYGLSYGGETAVRVPAILEDYCLSICSGDFNQWTRKVAAVDFPNGFMNTIEWEMPYWNLGHTFDYAEMAYLIFPRPFMAERGHHDRVSVDRWVAYEYAKVRWLYAQYALSDRTEIEFFQGGHSINGQATFAFLHKHLDWPLR